MTETDRQQAATNLERALNDRKTIPQPSVTWPGINLEDAYSIQRLWTAIRVQSGNHIIGHKVGLTSRTMQKSSGIGEPDYGHLFNDMHYSDGESIRVDRFLAPRIEVELAFVLGRDLRGPSVSVFDVLDATSFVVPSMEVIDYRTEVPRTIFDTIADNGAAGAFITGGRPIRPLDFDLRWVSATLSKNGIIEESGVSAAVMGHPAMSVAWLANKLIHHNTFLAEGHIVLSGSFTRPIAVAPRDTIHADYGPLGSFAVSFV